MQVQERREEQASQDERGGGGGKADLRGAATGQRSVL